MLATHAHLSAVDVYTFQTSSGSMASSVEDNDEKCEKTGAIMINSEAEERKLLELEVAIVSGTDGVTRYPP